MQKSEIAITANEQRLYKELAEMIEQSKQQAYSAVNSTMTLLFWRVSNRINQKILRNQRAEYGKRIVPTVSAQLEKAYGRNFTEKNVRRMLKFAEQFTDFNIVVLLSNQLSWSHFVELFPLKSQKARLFYTQK
jgi:hypothetical protein